MKKKISGIIYSFCSYFDLTLQKIARSTTFKKLTTIAILLLIGVSCFSQKIIFCGSLTNSFNEPRLQNSFGIGLQLQHDINQRMKIGAAIHYNFKHSNFHEEYTYIDGSYGPHWVSEINSKIYRISSRLNLQGILKEDESASISIGPEISYNFIWGQDEKSPWIGGPLSQRGWFTEKNDLIKRFGIGLIAEMEIKNFISPRLSLYSSIRPEFIIGEPVFLVYPKTFQLIEFQIGCKYRFIM